MKLNPMIARLLAEARGRPISFAADMKNVYDIVALLVTLLAGTLAFPSGGSIGGTGFFASALQHQPIRVVVFVVMAAAVGWTLASISSLVARNISEWAVVLTYFAAFAFAALLVSLADALFGYGSAGNFVGPLLTTIGLCIACVMANTEYTLFEAEDIRSFQFKAGVLALFTGTSLALALFVRLSA